VLNQREIGPTDVAVVVSLVCTRPVWPCDTGNVRTPINPPSIAPPAANYHHAVLVQQPSQWLHTSGVVPTASDGTTPDPIAEQAAVVWQNIAAMLADADMTPSDIVSVTTYVVFGEALGPVMAARDAMLGDHRAASTLVTVPALAQPQWRMEVSIVAAR
jgi:enamine deaminase RidA (YjgF/YER057c/UK114 family)